MKRFFFFLIIVSGFLFMACTREEPKPIAYPVDCIVLRTHELAMVPGEERVLHVDFCTTKSYFWSTQDSSIAQISFDGILTAMDTGLVAIVVMCKDWTTATDTAFVRVNPVPTNNWLPKTYIDFKSSRDNMLILIDSLGYEPLHGDSVGFRTINSITNYLFTYNGSEPSCYKIEQQVYGWADSITSELRSRYNCEDSIVSDLGSIYYLKTNQNNIDVQIVAKYAGASKGRNENSCYYIDYYPLSH